MNRMLQANKQQQSRKTLGSVMEAYLTQQVVGMTLVCVCGFGGVLMAGNALKDILMHWLAGRIEFTELIQLLGLLIPNVLPYALPMGLVCALLWVLGRMSADQEWVALKSIGVSPLRCFRPIGLFLVVCLVLTLAVSDRLLPQMAQAYRSTLKQTLHADPARFLEAGRFIRHFPGYIAYLGAREADRCEDVSVWMLDAQGRVQARVQAQQARIVGAPEQEAGALHLELYQGSLERYPQQDPEALMQESPHIAFFQKLPLRLPLGRWAQVASERQQLRFMSLSALNQARKQAHNQGLLEQAMHYQVHMSQRVALACSLLPLGLLGFTLGVRTRRRERSAGTALALGLTLGYYACLTGLSSLTAYPGLRPDLLLWVPNLLLLGLGSHWLKRA